MSASPSPHLDEYADRTLNRTIKKQNYNVEETPNTVVARTVADPRSGQARNFSYGRPSSFRAERKTNEQM